ncbi:MAG: hypothetical protein O3B31_03795 [Chloroflexi bacterium]|nr:hypothetical protein [Chloroflexota bacterium]MDA1002462.1 hypothetical protein [Chloroflexota bacterium]MQC27513.1 hypothetical protein [Chloroflexota bacterium]
MTAQDRTPELIPLVDTSGRNKTVEASDPYVATVVALSTPGYDGLAAMGRAFVEEFAMVGWSRARIARMFENPRFAAAYAVYQERGPEFVAALLDEVLGRVEPSPANREES